MNRYLLTATIVVVCAVSALYLMRPVSDPDFFWHLKTGQWIWENGQLPEQDPFSFTTPSSPDQRGLFILKSYWLGQLLYYAHYSLGGMSGIIWMRAWLVALLVFVLLKRRTGDLLLYLWLLVLFLVSMLEVYPVERPQAFSFVFFALLLYILEHIRKGSPAVNPAGALTALPLLMLVWANTHGGFIIGQITIGLYLAAEGLKFVRPSLRPLNRTIYKRLFIAGVAGLVLSLANPDTYHVMEILRLPSYAKYLNTDYMSTIKALADFRDYSVLLDWFVMLLALAGLLVNAGRVNITEVLLLGGTGYAAFTQVRYVPFFLIAAIPAISRAFEKKRLPVWLKALLIAMIAAAAVFFVRDEVSNTRNLLSGRWIDEKRYPVKAADYVLARNLRGNMYNHYDWGGYLIWRLGPGRKVFIDGRDIDEATFWKAMSINIAYTDNSGRPYWKSILESYHISYLIVPIHEAAGNRLQLVSALAKDSDWTLAFSDANSVVFLKKDPGK
ncbi:MAG: hypothetical protein EPN25_01025 [Nitrospirae bacterium]|nr:MAG: hypothetical protein EPN25_01025 [Nitrospirota bacterium]